MNMASTQTAQRKTCPFKAIGCMILLTTILTAEQDIIRQTLKYARLKIFKLCSELLFSVIDKLTKEYRNIN